MRRDNAGHTPGRPVTDGEDGAVAADPAPPAVAWYMVAVLTLIYIFATLDRNVLAIMVEDVRRSMAMSDLEIALLNGVAFAVFYTSLGLPIGHLVDRGPRRLIIYCGVTFWSLCSSSIALATGFGGFFAARTGVGAGEAALGPAAVSMIADRFPRRRLATAISVYSLGGVVGAGASLAFGGWLLTALPHWQHNLPAPFATWEPWRLVLLATGLPGVLLALLVWTFPEPPRRSDFRGDTRWRDFFAYVGQHRGVFVQMLLAWSLVAVIALGTTAWAPTYLRRTYGMTAAQAGATMGGVMAFAGMFSHVANGVAIDFLDRRGMRAAPLRFFCGAALLSTPFVLVGFVAHSVPLFVLGFLMKNLLLTPVTGYAAAAVQMITPSWMRGRASALFLMTFNIAGLAVGPVSVALLTERVLGDPLRVGEAIAMMIGVCSVAAVALLWNVRHAFARLAAEQA